MVTKTKTKLAKSEEGKKEKTKQENKSTKRKDRTGLPTISLLQAIKYIKDAHKIIENRLVNSDKLAEVMNIKKQYSSVVFGCLSSDYGLIQRVDAGWSITELGKRVVKDDRDAIVELIKKSNILNQLYNQLKDKDVDKSYIESLIKNKRGNYNVSYITEKYMEVIDYLNNLSQGNAGRTIIKKDASSLQSEEAEMILLMYSLFPLEKNEDIQSQLQRLIKLSEKMNMFALVNTLCGAKPFIKNKDDLNKIAEPVIKEFEDETGLILFPKKQLRKDKKKNEEKNEDDNKTEE